MDIEIKLVQLPDGTHSNVSKAQLSGNAGALTIGRDEGSDIHLPCEDRTVSRLHARIEWNETKIKLTDLSANGTFVNEQEIGHGQAQHITPGDNLKLGDYTLQIASTASNTVVQPLPTLEASPNPNHSFIPEDWQLAPQQPATRQDTQKPPRVFTEELESAGQPLITAFFKGYGSNSAQDSANFKLSSTFMEELGKMLRAIEDSNASAKQSLSAFKQKLNPNTAETPSIEPPNVELSLLELLAHHDDSVEPKPSSILRYSLTETKKDYQILIRGLVASTKAVKNQLDPETIERSGFLGFKQNHWEAYKKQWLDLNVTKIIRTEIENQQQPTAKPQKRKT